MRISLSIDYHLLGVAVLLLLCTQCGLAQQRVQHSLYMLDKYEHNAAYGGLDYSLSANVHYRKQWADLQGSPSNIHINAHLPFYVWSGALGTQIGSRNLGSLNYNSVSFSYNYVLKLSSGLWSNGLRVGVDQLRLSGSSILTPEGIYTGGSINHADPQLQSGLDAGFGLLWELSTYYKSAKWEAGLSLSHLPGTNISLENFVLDKEMHAIFYGQYNFTFLDEFDVLQSILLKTDFGSVQTDITSIVRINGNVFGGIGVRGYSSSSIDAVIILFGVDLSKNVTLSYSYDAGLSGIREVNEGSHGLLLNYNLQKLIGTGLPPRIIYNPRYL